MAMLMQTNDKPNEVLKCQKLKRCVSIPAPNDRIGFVLLLVLLMHVYIYIYNYIYNMNLLPSIKHGNGKSPI